MISISVIMPVYNSEKFLNAAIDSVLNQTYHDFELILIDDGSTDSSGSICDNYANADKRVRVVHQENGGICIARNRGLDLATGEYLAFIDNDDEYTTNLLDENIELLRKNPDTDMIKFGYHVAETFDNGVTEHRDTSSKQLLVIDSESLALNFPEAKKSGLFNMIWNGIYRRDFLVQNNLRFDETIKFGYEDWAFNYTVYPLARKVIINPGIYYIHLQRTGVSTSKKFYINRPYGCVSAAKTEKKLFENLGIGNYFPHLWTELIIKYLIEILVLFHYKDCNMKTSEKVDFLRKLKKDDLFSNLITRSDADFLFRTSKTKSAVKTLFYNNRFKTLLFLSKIYYYYLEHKNNRR